MRSKRGGGGARSDYGDADDGEASCESLVRGAIGFVIGKSDVRDRIEHQADRDLERERER